MDTVSYKLIKKQIEKSRYFEDGFDRVDFIGRVYYVPTGKYKEEEEYRNLALLALFPYIHKIANMAAKKFVWCFQDNAYMTIDDFVQDIFEGVLRNWKSWRPEKFKLTTMVFNLGLYWTSFVKWLRVSGIGHITLQL
jgi:hypothetical protein